MHRPKDISDTLGISPGTLRRWATAFADHLSPTAGAAIAETGGPAQRRFTDDDLALLAAIQRDLAGGRTIDEVNIRLSRGAITPLTDVVVDNATADQSAQRASAEPLTSGSSQVPALPWAVPGYGAEELAAALVAVSNALPTMGEALTQVQQATEALTAAAERQEAATRTAQGLLEEIREERAALELARAAAQAPPPEVLSIDASFWDRLRRLFTGN